MKPEEQNLLLEALGYAGETLDKPGRFARGLFSSALNYATGYGQADPQAMLNIVPFSDYFQLTDARKELNARQLYAPSYGGMNEPGSGQFWPSVGDAVLDMATDPTSYISLGIVPAVKTGIAGVKAVPKLMGFGAKAANAAPDIMSAASKVVPDAVTVASKISPAVVPTLESTTKSFGDVSSAGINSMEANFSRTGPPKLKAQVPETGRFIYQDVVPIDKRYASIADDGFNSFPLNNNKPFNYSGTDSLGSFASLTNQAPDIGKITDFSSLPSKASSNLDNISKTIDGMDLSILNKLDNLPLGASDNITKAFDYGADLGKVDPLTSTVGKSFNDINAAAAAVAAAEAVAPVAEKIPRTWAGFGMDTASSAANKMGKISEQSYENAARFVRNAVPDQQSLAEQRGQIQSTPSPNNPNRMISPDDPYGW
jgi:hypothetical protein